MSRNSFKLKSRTYDLLDNKNIKHTLGFTLVNLQKHNMITLENKCRNCLPYPKRFLSAITRCFCCPPSANDKRDKK